MTKFPVLNKNSQYDVAGIGSALLDLIVEVDDSFLEKLELNKGQMHLIDEARSNEILEKIKDLSMDVEPGGSSANTIAGVTVFDGKGIFMGKVGDDSHGDQYIKKTEDSGVVTKISKCSSMTGHAITFITPDHERTFATHLGAALNFIKEDVDIESIKKSKILHFEGYLFELPELRDACIYAIETAKENNVLVSIDLSDPALVDRIYDTFVMLLKDYVDIVFANEEEAKAFTKLEEEKALNKLSEYCQFVVVKLGSKGSLIKCLDEVYKIPIFETNVVNTNGAGDVYASGVLYGLSHGLSALDSGKLGSYAASKVISQSGARLYNKIDPEKI